MCVYLTYTARCALLFVSLFVCWEVTSLLPRARLLVWQLTARDTVTKRDRVSRWITLARSYSPDNFGIWTDKNVHVDGSDVDKREIWRRHQSSLLRDYPLCSLSTSIMTNDWNVFLSSVHEHLKMTWNYYAHTRFSHFELSRNVVARR